MKKFAIYILLLLPGIAFGQLFPKFADFKGNVEKVVEKQYGKEVTSYKQFKGIYRPKTFSGWKYTYLFDGNSNLIKRTNTFQGKIVADYLYQRDTIENRLIEREINIDNVNGTQGDYLEYEYFTDSQGRIEKINSWSFNGKEHTRGLFMIEQNVGYKQDKIISFTRHNIEINGDTASGEKCNLYYNPSGNLIRIERKDIDSGFTTVINYHNNGKGFVDHYSVDFLIELQEYGTKNQIQDIYYKYDRHGNWIRMYRKSGDKNRLEAKRKIKYRYPRDKPQIDIRL